VYGGNTTAKDEAEEPLETAIALITYLERRDIENSEYER